MQNINDAAFRLAQKIEDQAPDIWREELINQTVKGLIISGYESEASMVAAITQVASLENQNAMASIDLSLSTKDLVFINVPNFSKPQAIFVQDLIRICDAREDLSLIHI